MIRHLFISPGHSFFGQHGRGAAEFPTIEVPEVECLAGRGIRGDRFFDYKPDYKGQITFYAWEDLCRMWEDLGIAQDRRDASATRRNAITEGLDLCALVGKEFEVQGVRFAGSEECRPCYWMNGAIHPEAEAWMRGRGGLRARILCDGRLRSGRGARVCGALLAGGRSTRMGRDKATLEVGGEPLWRRQLDVLGSVCAPVAVFAPERPGWLPEGSTFVPDNPAARGPMAGLLAALEWAAACGASHVMALAVDMPRMDVGFLRDLAGPCLPGRGIIPQNGSLYEPLCAVYPVEALAVLSESARRGEWKLQEIAAALLAGGTLSARSPSPEDAAMFFNLNSPDDLAALSAR